MAAGKKTDTGEQPEKMDLKSADVAAERHAELLRLFPEVRTEGGKIDFERLKGALGEMIDAGRERYGLTWPGKADCFRTIQAPSTGTLRPARDESVNFDTTENLIIEGDNLEVLKLLQKSYIGRVKMIYIDPPYNTGNDFIYPDNFGENLKTYLQYTGQVDAEGRRFGTNTETDGRFHSKWLNMMYPRLYLARNLLREDGVIFISIDDNEVHNLRRICDDVFGEENRVGCISWKNVTDNNPTHITPDNEFIVCYARSKVSQPKAWKSSNSAARDLLEAEYERLKKSKVAVDVIQARLRDFISDNEESVGVLTRYKFVDADGVYTGSESVHNPSPGGYDFEVLHPQTKKPMRKPANGYRFPEATFREMERNGIILYGEDEQRIVKIKKYLAEYEDVLRSVVAMDGRLGSYDLKRLFPDEETIFTNPKPKDLVEALVSFTTTPGDLVLDFFAGSGTTGHASLNLANKGAGDRRWILVQLPQWLDETDKIEKRAHAFCTREKLQPRLSELTKERVRRVIKKLDAEDAGKLDLDGKGKQDRGFRVFKLDQSNFIDWDPSEAKDGDTLGDLLERTVDHVRQGRSDDDLLYELLLKSGFPLTTKVETRTIAGKTVHSIADGLMLICLDRALTLELIRAMADLKPERVVCLDAGFANNDQLKANAVLTFKSKGVVKFMTV
jgi:adenine-specific DNA-methyltransferase